MKKAVAVLRPSCPVIVLRPAGRTTSVGPGEGRRGSEEEGAEAGDTGVLPLRLPPDGRVVEAEDAAGNKGSRTVSVTR